MKTIHSWLISILFASLAFVTLSAQYNRQSVIQYQMDALALNPAYAGAAGGTTFEAVYLGNFNQVGVLSRLGTVSVHAPSASARTAYGANFEFVKTAFSSEIAVQPVFAFLRPSGNATLSAGTGIGFRYFDFDDDGFGGAPPNFAVLEVSLGLMFRNQRFFAGLSAANFCEATLKTKGLNTSSTVPRDVALSFSAGGLWQVDADLILKPSILLQSAERHFLPKDALTAPSNIRYTNLEFLPSVIVQQTYLIGLLAGTTRFDDGRHLNRVGLSVAILFDDFHLAYALVNNSNNENLELPASHMISAGYTFGSADNSHNPRFF